MPILRSSLTVALILTILLSACSGNNFVISTAYNRVDNSSAKRFYKYAKFDSTEKKQIKATIDQFHLWHRKQQLPLYIEMLSEIQISLETNDPLNQDKITHWLNTVYSFRDNIEQCNPMLQSAEFLAQLTDRQVLEIQERFTELQEKGDKRRAKYKPEEREKQRLKSMTKNLKFLGLRLNSSQINILAETMAETESAGNVWSEQWQLWKAEFIDLLEDRQQTDFKSRLQQHIVTLSQIPETHYPEILAANQKRWSNTALVIGKSLDKKQQADFLNVIKKVKSSLGKLVEANLEIDTSTAFPAATACSVV